MVTVAHVFRAGQIGRSPGGTLTFQGGEYGADVSFFLLDTEAGHGPKPHTHPYGEVFVVRSGSARFTVGDETVEAGPGDIVVAEPDEPHGFVSVGPDRLDMTCIHAHGRMITTWLD